MRWSTGSHGDLSRPIAILTFPHYLHHDMRNTDSELIARARRMYDDYGLDYLPRPLRRNSLDYYYLSIYPSLREMRPLEALPPYPDSVSSAYIHVPYCSGVCNFCSYYLVAISPRRREAIGRYLDLARQELLFHAARTSLEIRYLLIGGGTPSLIAPADLERFLAGLRDAGILSQQIMGTVELHPEFFGDPAAGRFLDILMAYGLGRVSVGYQVSDDDILHQTRRRHGSSFMTGAMSLLRGRGFLVNLDLMYGLPDQSLASWETTLRAAVAFEPDSIATYFLFVDKGTHTHELVTRGAVQLPSHRHIQTQHLMAQLYLGEQGYHELPNDFYARAVGDASAFRPDRLPSAAHTLPIGPGAYGYYGRTQLANVFDLGEYERRIRAGESPLWRGYTLTDEESLGRDVMFALKNDPFLDCMLFENTYNRSPLDVFAGTFERLAALELVTITGSEIHLTAKGQLCVEEISALFRHPAIGPAADAAGPLAAVLDKHNYAPAYPAAW